MSDLQALHEIEGIRKRRVESAENAQRLAKQARREAEQKRQEAELALQTYLERLLGLIEVLYADCIGHLVTRDFVQNKAHEETKLRARVQDYKAQVLKTEKALQAAIEKWEQATRQLMQERIKWDALKTLIHDEQRRALKARNRIEAKVLDELSGAQFVRRHLHKAARPNST